MPKSDFVLISLYLGAIAQLGERLHGMQEVVGSNPTGSIFYILLHTRLQLLGFCLPVAREFEYLSNLNNLGGLF